MMNVTLNNEKNGIEVRFDSKPESSVLENLKANGFHWSGKQHMWYAKQTEERMEFVKSISDGDFSTTNNKTEKHANEYNLFALTRTDSIVANPGYIHSYEGGYCEAVKSIAALIRKEFKKFPMVKASVRVDHHDRIDVTIKSSPFAKDSEEIKAIAHYIYTFAQSYNYDNSDSMTDYFDVGFYGVYESGMLGYHYEQTEANEEIKAISEKFAIDKAEFEAAEEARKEAEYQAMMKQREIERAEEAKAEEVRKVEHQKIVDNTQVNDVNYYVLNIANPGVSKLSSTEEYKKYFSSDMETVKAKVVKELRMSEEIYKLFAKHLIDDFDFFTANLGGTWTDDLRITDWMDYEQMSAAERETVETIEYHCVAVYCEDELIMVINTEGFSYARYCYFAYEDTKIVSEYKTALGMSEEEYEKYLKLATSLETISETVIAGNDMTEQFIDGSDENKIYKSMMKDLIRTSGLPFSVNVVRAIHNKPLAVEFKRTMYILLKEVDSIAEQFMNYPFETEQKITIVKINDFGGLAVQHCKYREFFIGDYAQHKDCVKLVIRPEGKRNDYYLWLYREVIIYDGWLDIPETLLWDISKQNGLVCKKSKYLSCDRAMYDEVLNYFKEKDIRPIINTYKPQF